MEDILYPEPTAQIRAEAKLVARNPSTPPSQKIEAFTDYIKANLPDVQRFAYVAAKECVAWIKTLEEIAPRQNKPDVAIFQNASHELSQLKAQFVALSNGQNYGDPYRFQRFLHNTQFNDLKTGQKRKARFQRIILIAETFWASALFPPLLLPPPTPWLRITNQPSLLTVGDLSITVLTVTASKYYVRFNSQPDNVAVADLKFSFLLGTPNRYNILVQERLAGLIHDGHGIELRAEHPLIHKIICPNVPKALDVETLKKFQLPWEPTGEDNPEPPAFFRR